MSSPAIIYDYLRTQAMESKKTVNLSLGFLKVFIKVFLNQMVSILLNQYYNLNVL
jgi:hypothetical protein